MLTMAVEKINHEGFLIVYDVDVQSFADAYVQDTINRAWISAVGKESQDYLSTTYYVPRKMVQKYLESIGMEYLFGDTFDHGSKYYADVYQKK